MEIQDTLSLAASTLKSEGISFTLIDGAKKQIAKDRLINSGFTLAFERVDNLDFNLIKKYADLFDEWTFISELRQKI